jgi:hypothetical protein
MRETPMERLERTLSRFNDRDLVPGELLRVEDLRAVVAVAKDARSWSDDVTKLVARVKELEAELETEAILVQATQATLESAHSTYVAWYAEWAEEAANRAREWTLRAVMKKVVELRLPATSDELCTPARRLTAEELLRPWTH